MTKEEIISQYLKDPEYKRMCQLASPDHADDLYQDLTIYLLEMDGEKLIRLASESLRGYFYQMVSNQVFSKNSNFYRKYKRDRQMVRAKPEEIIRALEPLTMDKDILDKVLRAKAQLYWYDKDILDLYYEMGTLKKLAEDVGIPIASIHYTVKTATSLLKKKIKKIDD